MRLVDKFLESAAKALEEMSQGTSRPVEPLAMLLTGFLSTVALSFSRSTLLCAAGLAASAMLVALYAPRAARTWASTLILLAAAVLVVALPLVIGGGDVTLFILRTVSSAAYFTAATAGLGWRGVAEALAKLGAPEAALDVSVFTRYLPLFLRDAAVLMAARESRSLEGRHGVWELSTIIGEMMARAYRRSRSLYYAAAARDLGGYRGLSCRLRLYAWDMPHIAVAAAIVAGWWLLP